MGKFPRFKLLEDSRTRIKILEESKPRIYTSRNLDLEVKKYALENLKSLENFPRFFTPRGFTPRPRFLVKNTPIPRC